MHAYLRVPCLRMQGGLTLRVVMMCPHSAVARMLHARRDGPSVAVCCVKAAMCVEGLANSVLPSPQQSGWHAVADRSGAALSRLLP